LRAKGSLDVHIKNQKKMILETLFNEFIHKIILTEKKVRRYFVKKIWTNRRHHLLCDAFNSPTNKVSFRNKIKNLVDLLPAGA
jgi:hypothetical protein